MHDDPVVEVCRQGDGNTSDGDHRPEAMPLLERQIKHADCPVDRRPRRRIFLACPTTLGEFLIAAASPNKTAVTRGTTLILARIP